MLLAILKGPHLHSSNTFFLPLTIHIETPLTQCLNQNHSGIYFSPVSNNLPIFKLQLLSSSELSISFHPHVYFSVSNLTWTTLVFSSKPILYVYSE